MGWGGGFGWWPIDLLQFIVNVVMAYIVNCCTDLLQFVVNVVMAYKLIAM